MSALLIEVLMMDSWLVFLLIPVQKRVISSLLRKVNRLPFRLHCFLPVVLANATIICVVHCG